MREKYWTTFTDLKFKEFYFVVVQHRAKQINGVLDCFCLFVTTASVSAWSLWGQAPVLWAALIALSQVISILKPKFPFSDQIVATRFLLPELSKLLLKVDRDWNSIDVDKWADSRIKTSMYKHEESYHELIAHYVGEIYLPQSWWYCMKTATESYDKYFWHRYSVKKEGT